MIFHFAGYTLQSTILSRSVELGWMGVDLFFVLSGYLITGILLDTKGQENYLRNFYLRRAFRIFPLYYLAVLIFFWVELPLAHRLGFWAPLQSHHQYLYWLHLSNWVSAYGELAASPVGPFWSLAIEEQFYLVWPFVVLLTGEFGLAIACAILAIGSAGLRFFPEFQALHNAHPEFLYRLTPFRIEPLCYGALIALAMRRLPSRRLKVAAPVLAIVGVSLIVFAVLRGHTTKYQSIPMASYGLIGVDLLCAGLVMAAVANAGAPGALGLFRSTVLRTFGQYSYSMYIFHVQVAMLMWIALDRIAGRQGWVSVLAVGIGLATSVAVGWCSWRVVEKPLLRLKDRIAPSARLKPTERTSPASGNPPSPLESAFR